MDIAIYRRPHDGAVFAVVAPKTGGATDYLWQYLLTIGPQGPSARLVRRFGTFSGLGPEPGEAGEIEAIAVDHELGFIYYADERFGIRKWHADPDHPDAAGGLAVLGRDGYLGDREGLALYQRGQRVGLSRVERPDPRWLALDDLPRSGGAGGPHDQPLLRVVNTPSDETDGLDISARAVPKVAGGLLVMMNSAPHNSLMYAGADVAARLPAPPPTR